MGTSSAFSGPAPNVFLKIYWAAFPSRKILLGRTSRFPGHLLGRPSVPSQRPRPYLGLLARAHTPALEPMPPRRGHVKSLSGHWLAGSPWIWHCAQIYLPDLGVALRMGWIRSFQEVHLPRALNITLRAFNNPGVRNSSPCALHAVTALMYDRPMQPARG